MTAPSPDELAAIAAALRLRSATAAQNGRERSAWLADARSRAVSPKPNDRDRKDAEGW
jgi:hypothetical protein